MIIRTNAEIVGGILIAALNTRAFGYESIRDTQGIKGFWRNIGAFAVVIGPAVLAVVVPPVGFPLALGVGALYGSLEAKSAISAISGKDRISSRELGTGEYWFRGKSPATSRFFR